MLFVTVRARHGQVGHVALVSKGGKPGRARRRWLRCPTLPSLLCVPTRLGARGVAPLAEWIGPPVADNGGVGGALAPVRSRTTTWEELRHAGGSGR